MRRLRTAGQTLPMGRERAFWEGVHEAGRFFMGQADVHQALERLAGLLDEREIPYALIGGMALNEWGYRRVTVDLNLLLTSEGLQRLNAAALARGYVKSGNRRGLRDPDTG